MLLADPTPEEAASMVAIQQLAACYAEAVSRGDVDEAVLVYADDGVLRSPTTDDAVGHAAIAAVIKTATADLEFVFQTVHTGLIAVSGDRARARMPITEWARRRDGAGLQFLGYYEDEVRRQPAGWRYTSRLLVPLTLGRHDHFKGRALPLDILPSLLS